ncbi:sugar-phosphatase [Acetilactobacillus jinshanensis]|uniref:Sugar-phosphatase n=1 Tax=Acetilactobacillus jinshanensis TaxID=1720083 RepID=A0A4P6ZNZ5_9LACO|nr:sugar-phosphatase [Acetilactobacillus jinshanensis]QBP18880.1 sugar-phosphatase [Acetilactobacillus jinshanensis]URL60571.1 sugar-phosphatase [uncultured bacterium]
MDIKMIGIDIDGTLVNDKKQLTPVTEKVIKAAMRKGVKIVICTGRPLAGTQQYLNQLGITGRDNYVVGFNGAIAQSTDGEIIDDYRLSYDNFLTNEMISRKFGVNFQIETPNAIYALNRDISKYTVYEARLVHLPLKYRTPEEIKPDLSISKTMWISEPDKITNLKKHIPQSLKDRMYIVQTEPVFLEAMHKGVSKGQTLIKLASQIGLKPENVMAMGDQGNDVSLMKYAGLGVGMANGIEDVKRNADFITKNNNENGVAYAIKKFVLDK